jgi:hypothetical protein
MASASRSSTVEEQGYGCVCGNWATASSCERRRAGVRSAGPTESRLLVDLTTQRTQSRSRHLVTQGSPRWCLLSDVGGRIRGPWSSDGLQDGSSAERRRKWTPDAGRHPIFLRPGWSGYEIGAQRNPVEVGRLSHFADSMTIGGFGRCHLSRLRYPDIPPTDEAARCRSERHSEVVVVSGLSRSPLFYDLGVGPRVSEGSNSCRRHSTKDQSPPLAGSPRRCPGLQEDEAAGAVPQTNWRCNE